MLGFFIFSYNKIHFIHISNAVGYNYSISCRCRGIEIKINISNMSRDALVQILYLKYIYKGTWYQYSSITIIIYIIIMYQYTYSSGCCNGGEECNEDRFSEYSTRVQNDSHIVNLQTILQGNMHGIVVQIFLYGLKTYYITLSIIVSFCFLNLKITYFFRILSGSR